MRLKAADRSSRGLTLSPLVYGLASILYQIILPVKTPPKSDFAMPVRHYYM